MSNREWYPADWVDEICPTAKPTPDAFIVDCGGLYLLGYALDDKDSDDDERETFNRPLAIGDIVRFMCCDRLDDVEVTFSKGGEHTVHGQIPDHNWVRLEGDQDSMHHSFADLVRAVHGAPGEWGSLSENVFHDCPVNRVTLEFARWSNGLPHRLVIEGGKPKFEQVPASTANN